MRSLVLNKRHKTALFNRAVLFNTYRRKNHVLWSNCSSIPTLQESLRKKPGRTSSQYRDGE